MGPPVDDSKVQQLPLSCHDNLTEGKPHQRPWALSSYSRTRLFCDVSKNKESNADKTSLADEQTTIHSRATGNQTKDHGERPAGGATGVPYSVPAPVPGETIQRVTA